MTTPIFADDAAIGLAADLLRQGCLVAFPTETVYGLGADAGNPEAVARIFAAKGRPTSHPLIVHLADAGQLSDWAAVVPEAALKLAAKFWPGPLALVLPKQDGVSPAVTGGQPTVALRVPNHPVALKLLRAFGGGIAAPSANRFCRISPTTAGHVAEELGDAVAMILDGGACQVGVESTIVDLTGGQPKLLRPGQIHEDALAAVLGIGLVLPAAHRLEARAPGMMALHYAPVTATELCAGEQLQGRVSALLAGDKRVGILAHSRVAGRLFAGDSRVEVTAMPEAADAYAQVLYASLRQLDRLGLDKIIVERPPQASDWRAVNDRLAKAAGGGQ